MQFSIAINIWTSESMIDLRSYYVQHVIIEHIALAIVLKVVSSCYNRMFDS